MTTRASRSLPFLLILTACVAACSIAYELIVAKSIAELAGNPPLWESLTIGIYILSLGVGALCAGRLQQRDAPLRSLVIIELLLTTTGALAGFGVLLLHAKYRIDLYDDGQLRAILAYPPVIWFAIPAQMIAASVGFLSGFELPLLMRAAATTGAVKTDVKILIAYYGGTLLGTVWFGVALAFNLTNLTTGLVTASVNLTVALALVLALKFTRKRRALLMAIVVLGLVILQLGRIVPTVIQLHAKNFYYNRHDFQTKGIGGLREFFPVPLTQVPDFLAAYPDIERHRTKYQVIDIVTNGPSPLDPTVTIDGFTVYINGRFQLSQSSYKDYHQNLGVKPSEVTDTKAQNVLILGGGDGLLAAAMLGGEHAPTNITIVDIDPTMLALAKTDPRLLALNRGALTHSSVQVVVDDAFNYLRYTKTTYDAVFIDVTFPFDLDSARFWTVEIFRMVHRRLTARGYVAAPLPMSLDGPLGARLETIVTNTLGQAGFRDLRTYKGEADSYLVTTDWMMPALTDDASLTAFTLNTAAGDAHSLMKPARFLVPDPFF